MSVPFSTLYVWIESVKRRRERCVGVCQQGGWGERKRRLNGRHGLDEFVERRGVGIGQQRKRVFEHGITTSELSHENHTIEFHSGYNWLLVDETMDNLADIVLPANSSVWQLSRAIWGDGPTDWVGQACYFGIGSKLYAGACLDYSSLGDWLLAIDCSSPSVPGSGSGFLDLRSAEQDDLILIGFIGDYCEEC